ncbi:hypothetical protein C2S52_017828 [Perilla frutescens var. hirtella]|nr:hypothetical protein C2S52_017828 [Perilla frutescens var. hirtella]
MNSKAEDYGYGDSACKFTWINDLVLTEILVCLPAKSLMRFMSVCKKWRSIISSDQFRRLHTLRHPKPPLSLLLTTSTSDLFYFHPYLKQLTPYNFSTVWSPIIVNSCNGLLLLRSNHDYYVYNPTTKQSRKLKLTHNGRYPRVVGLNLAFDPSKSPHYKIICLRTRKNYGISRHVYQIEVYTSESRAWELRLEAFTISSPVFSTLGMHCNNFIYWPGIGVLPYFDIAKNVIKYLSCPKVPRPKHEAYVSWTPHLQELNGHLHYYVEASDGECETVQLWEMQGENDDPRWLFKYHDRISPTPSSSPHRVAFPLRIVTRGSGKMRICRFLDTSCKEVGLRSQPFDHQDVLELHSGDVHQFAECLALV